VFTTRAAVDDRNGSEDRVDEKVEAEHA
jgi:hypothetical protein